MAKCAECGQMVGTGNSAMKSPMLSKGNPFATKKAAPKRPMTGK